MNVRRIDVENGDPSELAPFSKIQRSRWHIGCMSFSCGPLKFKAKSGNADRVITADSHHSTAGTQKHLLPKDPTRAH